MILFPFQQTSVNVAASTKAPNSLHYWSKYNTDLSLTSNGTFKYYNNLRVKSTDLRLRC